MDNLFVCTGNTCRSAIAEGLYRIAAKEAGLDTHAISAGISVFSPEPATELAVKAAAELGADISGHLAKAVNPVMIGAVDVVHCMTHAHLDILKLMFPQYAAKLRLLDPDSDIDDPYGGTLEQYRLAARQIMKAVNALVRNNAKRN